MLIIRILVNKTKLFSFSRERIWLFAMVLVLATIFAYRPAWNGSFVWDDDFYVTKNRLLTAPDGLRRIWFSLESPSQYFPLTYTSFRIERTLWGLNPSGYHWVNILLHTANALLLWRLLTELGVPGAWLAAGIFAFHPVQVESVAWITERKNVLMAFFAVKILPNHSHAHYNLAVALAEKGETVDAIAHYEKAIEAPPDFFEALTNLAWIFASSSEANIRNGPKAVELAEKASRLTDDTSPVILRTLAAAYATNKSFDKAIETSRRALQTAQEQRNSELAEIIRREMSLYEFGLPYRAP